MDSFTVSNQNSLERKVSLAPATPDANCQVEGAAAAARQLAWVASSGTASGETGNGGGGGATEGGGIDVGVAEHGVAAV